MPAVKLCYRKLDFESRLAKNHTTTIALKGKKDSAALMNVKMQDICTVLWGFRKWERVDATWLHFPYAMVLVHWPEHILRVRLGNLPVTVASFLFSKVIKTTPASGTEGGLGVLMGIKPSWEPPSSAAKQVVFTHSKARFCSSTRPVLTSARVSSASQIRITSTIKHQFWETGICQLREDSLPVMLSAGQLLLTYLTGYIG